MIVRPHIYPIGVEQRVQAAQYNVIEEEFYQYQDQDSFIEDIKTASMHHKLMFDHMPQMIHVPYSINCMNRQAVYRVFTFSSIMDSGVYGDEPAMCGTRYHPGSGVHEDLALPSDEYVYRTDRGIGLVALFNRRFDGKT